MAKSLWVLMEDHRELEEFKEWRTWRKRNIWSNEPMPVKMNVVKGERLAHEPSGSEPEEWVEPEGLEPLVIVPKPGLQPIAQPKKGGFKHEKFAHASTGSPPPWI